MSEELPSEPTTEAQVAEVEAAQTEVAQTAGATTPEASEASDVEGVGSGAEVPRAVALAEHLVRSIVDEPEAVGVAVVPGEPFTRLDVTVAKDDLGRVIGRRGRTAASLRTAIRAAAHLDGADVDVEFLS